MDIRLPQLAEGADSGTVVNLTVSVGERIQKGQTILELENQKAVAPIPSPAGGVVSKIHVKVGETISVGQVLVSLAEEGKGAAIGENQTPRQPTGQEKRQTQTPSSLPGSDKGGRAKRSSTPPGIPPPASPSVRKLADTLGIDLTQVAGSERGGRITLEDLRRYVAQLQTRAAQPPRGGESAPRPNLVSVDFSKWGPVRREKLSSVRTVIAKTMTESWTTVPHVTQFDEADISDLLGLKEKYEAAYDERSASLTVTGFILKTVARLLRQHPKFNASLDEVSGEVVFKDYVHLGIAVDTPSGLIVPVLQNVDKKSLLEISKELQYWVERTRARKVEAKELVGATFTVSNQGGIGGGHFTPIIHKPESAVLGVGRGVRRPVFVNDQVAARLLLPLSLSYDHRLIDGADAARFIRDLRAALEQFPERDVKIRES